MRPNRIYWGVCWAIMVLVLFFSLVADAGAQEPVLDLSGHVAFAPSPLLLDAMAAADESWRVESGVTEGNYCPVDFRQHQGYPDFGAIVSVCIITLNQTGGLPLLAQAEGPDTVGRHRALVLLCVTLKHERGHILGYPDQGPQGAGVMTALLHEMYPPACTRFADAHMPATVLARPAPATAPQKGARWDHTIGAAPCGRKCRKRVRAFVCQKADTALTSGARTPKMCRTHRPGGRS